MESQELISDFRKQLNHVEMQGNQQVQVSALRSYLDALERDATPAGSNRLNTSLPDVSIVYAAHCRSALQDIYEMGATFPSAI